MKISLLLKDIVRKNEKDRISIADILETNKNNSYFLVFLMAILSLIPTPFPFPFFSSFFGIVASILFLQIFFGVKNLRLPNFVKKMSVKKEMFEKVVNKVLVYIEKIEKNSYRRMTFYKNRILMIAIKFVILAMCLLLIIPVPLTNTLPAFGIIITIFGILNSDGLFVFGGVLLSIIGGSIFLLSVFFGKVLLQKFGWLK